jgi:hypothetical protein
VEQGRTVDAFSQSVRRLLRTASRERLDTQSPVQPHTRYPLLTWSWDREFCNPTTNFVLGGAGSHSSSHRRAHYLRSAFRRWQGFSERGSGFRVPSQSGDLLENNLAIFWLHTRYESRKQKPKNPCFWTHMAFFPGFCDVVKVASIHKYFSKILTTY